MFRSASFIIFLFITNSSIASSTDRNNPLVTTISLEAGYVNDDNLNNAANSYSSYASNTLDLLGRVSLAQKFSPNSMLIYSGILEFDKHNDYTPLDSKTFGLNIQWQFVTYAGFYAPLYQISIEYKNADYESNLRDGSGVSVEASLLKRFTDRISTIVGFSHRQRDAKNNSVFDVDEQRIFTNIDYMLSSQSTVYLSYSLKSGDIVATSEASPAYLNWSEAWVIDDAFSQLPGNTRYGNNYYCNDNGYNYSSCNNTSPPPNTPAQPVTMTSYRMLADTTIAGIGFNYAANEKNALDLSFLSIHADVEGPNTYDRQQLRLSYLFRF